MSCAARVFPQIASHVKGQSLLRVLDEQHRRFQSLQSLRRFSRPASELPHLASSSLEQTTIHAFSLASASTGFV